MLLRRDRGGPDPWLDWKVRLFAVGAGLGLAGIYLESGWLILAAVAVLFGGVTLRWIPGAGDSEDADDGEGAAPVDA